MFNSDIQVGNKGENIIYNYLINHPSTDSLIDVSKDKWFQQFDIDFIQVTNDEINKIEVKTDKIAVAIVIPAEGPSFGTAPSGT